MDHDTLVEQVTARVLDSWRTARSIAHHEAGHAVACAVLGVEVHYATVARGDDGSTGHVRHAACGDVDDLVIAAAGPVAEAWLARAYDPRILARSARDLAGITGRLGGLGLAVEDMRGPMTEAFGLAAEIVRLRWRAVDRLATELLGRETVGGAEIRRMVEEATRT
jgi:hypothetical protein